MKKRSPFSVGPVSYTHLDVYKRQEITKAKIAIDDLLNNTVKLYTNEPESELSLEEEMEQTEQDMSVSYTHLDVYKRQILVSGVVVTAVFPCSRLQDSPVASKEVGFQVLYSVV